MSSASEGATDIDDTSSYGAFITVMVLNVALFIAIFFAFWILRTRSINEYFFAPRLYDSKGMKNKNLPDPGRGLISWVKPVVDFSEDELFQTQSLDGVMYYKIQKMLSLIFLSYIPIGIGILIPINVRAGGGLTGIPELSMSNVLESDSRLWAHSSCCLIFTLFTLYFMYRLYVDYEILRVRWMQRNAAHNYTVMFKGVPKQQLKQHGAEELFNNIYPGEIVSAFSSENQPVLRDSISEWETTDLDLTFASAAFQTSGVRPTHKTKLLCGDEVDSIQFYTDKTAMLSRHISSHKDLMEKEPNPTHVVFVTYKTIESAYRASQCVVSDFVGQFRAQPAPHEKDVYWKMYERPQWRRAVMTPIVYLIATLMIIFWSAIIVFAQGIVNLPALARSGPAFSFLLPVLDWNPVVIGIISGYLPALIVIIATALLPVILRALVELAGVYTHSQARRRVLRLYFLFLVINVFLVTVIAGGALTVIDKLVNGSVTNVLLFLGQSLPAQSFFFINYILVYALFSYPLRILRIGNFIVSRLKRFLAKSEVQIRFIEKPPPFTYDLLYGTQLLMFVIGFAYTPIAPFIIPFCLIFYAFTYLFGKYTMIYVESPEYDSGGLDWPVFFRRMIASMIIGQLVMIGIFILKKSPALVIIAFLPIITLSFGIIVHRRFFAVCNYLPLLKYPQHDVNNQIGDQYRETYKDPITRDRLDNSLLDDHTCDLELGDHKYTIDGGSSSTTRKGKSVEEEDSYEFEHPTELGGSSGGAHIYSPASRKKNFKE